MTVEQLRPFISSIRGKVNGVKIVFYGGNILPSGKNVQFAVPPLGGAAELQT